MYKLLQTPVFVSKLLNIVFDEGHCISTWKKFRSAYERVGMLRYLLPGVPFYVASATLPPEVLSDVLDTLNLRRHQTKFIMHSNDRPDVYLTVREMKHAVSRFEDLAFLIPDGWRESDGPPPKFLVFFDSIQDTEAAVRYLRTRLPEKYAKKIRYFHATMTGEYRDEELEAYRDDDGTWGMAVTDAFGMVSGANSYLVV